MSFTIPSKSLFSSFYAIEYKKQVPPHPKAKENFGFLGPKIPRGIFWHPKNRG